MKHIKAIDPPVHLGEKASASIPDAQYTVLDLQARTILVQLPYTDDGVPHGGDVVDTSEKLMLPPSPVLASKMMEPTPLISTAEASLN
jgi:hypothetical protein